MNWKVFWGIFIGFQLVGALGLASGASIHATPYGLLLTLVFLLPGSLICWVILDSLGIGTDFGPLLVSCFLLNIVSWSMLALVIKTALVRKSR
jgi:hypothetical protein